MREATARAEKRHLARVRTPDEDLPFLLSLLTHARTGILPTDDEVARLGFLLTDLRLRDEAWIRIDEDAPAADIAFWRDILRRVEEPCAPAPHPCWPSPPTPRATAAWPTWPWNAPWTPTPPTPWPSSSAR